MVRWISKYSDVAICSLIVCAAFLPSAAFARGSYVNFEGKQTSPVRLSADGTLRSPVNIWDVRHEGRIDAGGVQRDVTFIDTDHH